MAQKATVFDFCQNSLFRDQTGQEMVKMESRGNLNMNTEEAGKIRKDLFGSKGNQDITK